MLDGKITYEAVAEAHGLEYTPLDDVLARLRGLGGRSRGRLPGFRLLRLGRVSLTTSHVTPAASAMMTTM